MEPSLSAGSSQRGASVKWTAKLIWPAGGESAARPGVAAHGTKDKSNATRVVRRRNFLTMPLSITSPHPALSPSGGEGCATPSPSLRERAGVRVRREAPLLSRVRGSKRRTLAPGGGEGRVRGSKAETLKPWPTTP